MREYDKHGIVMDRGVHTCCCYTMITSETTGRWRSTSATCDEGDSVSAIWRGSNQMRSTKITHGERMRTAMLDVGLDDLAQFKLIFDPLLRELLEEAGKYSPNIFLERSQKEIFEVYFFKAFEDALRWRINLLIILESY